MNLRKLLTLGRSFIEFGDRTGRYRMGKDNLLPAFGNRGTEIPGISVGQGASPTAQREKNAAEGLLSQVKVVRNDLNDAGVEVLPLRRPPAPGNQRMALPPQPSEPPVVVDQKQVPVS